MRTSNTALRAVLVWLFLIGISSAAGAQVVQPGETLSGLMAEAFDTTCSVGPDCDAFGEVGLNLGHLAVAPPSGPASYDARLLSSFSVGGDDGTPLLGSQLSIRVGALGGAESEGPGAVASYRLDLYVFDDTAGHMIATAKIAGDSVSDGSLGIDVSELVVLPLALSTGHEYTVVLAATGSAESSGPEKASVDLFSDAFFGWSEAVLRVGLDPAADLETHVSALDGMVTDLSDRVTDLETAQGAIALRVDGVEGRLDALEPRVQALGEELDLLRAETTALAAALQSLSEAFEGHSHTYLTGRGVGHNNTEATTSIPEDGEAAPEASSFSTPAAVQAAPNAKKKNNKNKKRRRNRRR